ncbi:TrkH family potassium uptake protein [candidate division WOR-3 bacterium]|nr:TrkH family potassium uptake protein [candidate division WOR-3 bacterium]
MRAADSLVRQYRVIICYVGLILFVAGLIMFTPLLAIFAQPNELSNCFGFILPGIMLVGIGLLLWRILRPRTSVPLTLQEGGVIVVLSWVTVCLFSALPFFLIEKLNFTHALFESISGWTTTGLSVVDVTSATHTILLWRSIMQLAGGAGLAIIMLAAITGPAGPGLSAAEGRGEQLVPHVLASAKIVITIYSGYAVSGILAYWLAGMNLFDAVNHAFTAVSTGGFSTRIESIGYWNSSIIEIITIVLMIFGSLNYLTAYLLLHGRFKAVYRSGELRLAAILAPVCAVLLFLLVCSGIYSTLAKCARVAIFETITALTTTGFTTTSYSNWGSLGFLILIVLMLIGGGTCSTAGGIKQYRIYVLFKAFLWGIKRSFLPRTAVTENYVWRGERKDFISDQRIWGIATFVFLYLTTYIIGSGIVAAYGYGLKESLFEFASALGTVGLSTGLTSASAPPLILWTEIMGMFLGRLEFLVIFIGIGKMIRDFHAMLR